MIGLKQWRQYLIGSDKFEVWTDHKNLKHFRKPQKLNCCQARWLSELQDYNFKIIHKSENLMKKADILSQQPDHNLGKGDNEERTVLKGEWFILSFPLTITMVKSNIQNKFYATNARPPGPQATPTSVGESPDSLNLISHASSRAGKCIHPRERFCARHTVKRSFRSVSAAEDSRKASPEPSSSSEEEESKEEEVSPGSRTPTASRIITGKLSHRIAPLPLLLKGEHIL